MNLVNERNKWRDSFKDKPLSHYILNDYRKNRDSEFWRVSKAFEQLCEYILYLENRSV